MFDAFDDDSDYKNIRKAEHIIQQYDAKNKISNLSQNQKNKINAIFIIHDWKYVIILIYHCNSLNNMNSDENYNSENNFNYSSSVKNNNCNNENDNDKNDFISSLMQKISKIVNIIINQIM